MRRPRTLLRRLSRTSLTSALRRRWAAFTRSRGVPPLFVDYASLLPRHRPRTVALVVEHHQTGELRRYLRRLRHDRAHVILIGSGDAPVIVRHGVVVHRAADFNAVPPLLKVTRPVHMLIVLARADDGAHATLWRKAFLHLQPGGCYVVMRAAIDGPHAAGGFRATLSEVAASRDGSGAEPLPRLDAELAAGTNQILLARDLVLVRKRTRHYLKVREAEVEQVFATREPRIQLEVLTSLPGGELRSPTTVHSYASAVPIAWLDTVLDYPPAQLRHYDGRVAVALNSLLLGESTVLPESFRYHFARELQHPRAVDVDTDFCRVPAAAIPKTTLQGAYYDLECHFPGHFGHVMTEVVSKLWGWDAAKARIPGLKALISAADDRSLALERRILTAYGIAPEDVVEVREPVWLEHLLGVTALWHNQVPHCVHPQLSAVWDRLRGGMALEGGPAHRRIFVSRGKAAANRECRNAKEVEGLFARFGFEVVYPELHDLSEQAAMFRDAEVIAGFGGAAMFNALYCSSLQTLIVLNHEAYTARNEHLISLLRPCEAHYFWSTPDFPHPPGYWYGSAFQSAWEFDFDRNEAELTSLLASLR